MDDETVDTLFGDSLQLVQAKNGYRFSLDPLLLANFVNIAACGRGLDLGAGCGVLPLLLVRRSKDLNMVGWERQPQMVARAKRGVELSGFGGRVEIVAADLRKFRDLTMAGSFDLVVTNPPYRGSGKGRVAPDDERAAARHELFGGLGDFLAAASWALRYRGRFAIVYLAERLPELLAAMTALGLEPKRLRLVHPRAGEGARMVLVEGLKGGGAGLKVEPPLYIYNSAANGRDYSDEVLQMYAKVV